MGIERWNQRYLESREIGHPVPLVQEIANTLRPGRALDLACGSGRNAVWLAQQGWDVTAVDAAPAAIALLGEHPLTAVLANLENGDFDIGESGWDLIVMSYYLQPSLFAPALAGLKPGGVLIVIVLTNAPGEEPKRHRLSHGELPGYFSDCEILHYREGAPSDGSHHSRVAEVALRKPAKDI